MKGPFTAGVFRDFLAEAGFLQADPRGLRFGGKPTDFEAPFGLGHGCLRSFNINVLSLLRDLGQDGDFAWARLDKAPEDRHIMIGLPNPVPQLTKSQRGHEMAMAGEDTKIAVGPGSTHLIHLLGEEQTLRRDDFQKDFSSHVVLDPVVDEANHSGCADTDRAQPLL